MCTNDSAYSWQHEELRANRIETTVMLSLEVTAMYVLRRSLHAFARVISSSML